MSNPLSANQTQPPDQSTGRNRARPTVPGKVIRQHFESDDEFFGQQPSERSDLPDPQPLLENLTRCVIEILAGARDLEQISRWVTDDVYRHLLKRVVLSARARQAKGLPGTQAGLRDRVDLDVRTTRRRGRGGRRGARSRPHQGRGPATRGARPPVARHRDQRALSAR